MCLISVLEQPRVAPRLAENRVPGGGYPEPSEPEPYRFHFSTRGYLDPGYPDTRSYCFTEPPPRGIR